jgi:lysophospholipase L1-like esterase
MGDSLTASYAGTPYGAEHQSWSDLLAAGASGQVVHFNFAEPGAPSSQLVQQGQHRRSADVVCTFHATPGHLPGPLPFVTLISGANDISLFLEQRMCGVELDPLNLIAELVRNVAAALDTVLAAGESGIVLGTVPDISVTPRSRDLLRGVPALTQAICELTRTINTQLVALARVHRVPVVDLTAMNQLASSGGLRIGGLDVGGHMFGADGFHPSTLGQGLLHNAILAALQRGYGLDVSALCLSDNDLLAAQGLPPGREGFLDVRPFVLFPEPEPLSLERERERRGRDGATDGFSSRATGT